MGERVSAKFTVSSSQYRSTGNFDLLLLTDPFSFRLSSSISYGIVNAKTTEQLNGPSGNSLWKL